MYASSGDYAIYYETAGDAAGRPLLLVSGLGGQCISWPAEFVRMLVDVGFMVICFDNRDVGLSTKSPEGASYLLGDMACDAVAVLDALDIDAVHLCGSSMGAMIAQTIAIEHPDRVASLTSISSNAAFGAGGGATPEALAALMEPAPIDREGNIERAARTSHALGGPHVDDALVRAQAALAYDRCFDPKGAELQFLAAAGSPDRTEGLRGLAMPTTVIHGRIDPLIPLAAGEAVADAITDAKLVILDENGHDFAPTFWPIYVAELVAVADRADAT